MSNDPREALPTLDLEALETVAGGRRRATASSSSNMDMQLLDALDDIESALKDVASKSNTGNSDLMNNLMMMQMMGLGQQQQPQPQTMICERGRKRC